MILFLMNPHYLCWKYIHQSALFMLEICTTIYLNNLMSYIENVHIKVAVFFAIFLMVLHKKQSSITFLTKLINYIFLRFIEPLVLNSAI